MEKCDASLKLFNQYKHFCKAYINLNTNEHLDSFERKRSALRPYKTCRLLLSGFHQEGVSKLSKVGSKSSLGSEKDLFLSHYNTMKSKAVFFQSPYPEHWPNWFTESHDLFDYGYIGYFLSVTDYPYAQFASPLIQNSKYLIAGSPYELEYYQRECKGATNIIFAGNSLMFKLRAQMKKSASHISTGNNKILWAPHFSNSWIDDSRGFSRWRLCIEPIFKLIKQNPNLSLTFRPHPLLANALKIELNSIPNETHQGVSLFSKSELSQFRNLLSLPNVEFSEGPMLDDIIKCEALVPDGLSIISYWAATGKPMLVVQDALTPPWNQDGVKILGASEKASTELEVNTWLNIITKKRTMNNLELIKISNEIHPTFGKSPVDIFIEHLS